MDICKRKVIKYDVFINTVDGIKDEYKNVELRFDDIFITVTLSNGKQIGYPVCNISRITFVPNTDGINN
jgi:hypothetical protein